MKLFRYLYVHPCIYQVWQIKPFTVSDELSGSVIRTFQQLWKFISFHRLFQTSLVHRFSSVTSRTQLPWDPVTEQNMVCIKGYYLFSTGQSAWALNSSPGKFQMPLNLFIYITSERKEKKSFIRVKNYLTYPRVDVPKTILYWLKINVSRQGWYPIKKKKIFSLNN